MATLTEKIQSRENSLQPAVKITHFADLWCWWSWGLEPVIARLKEVYQDQVQIEYRMGGMAETKQSWLRGNGVQNDTLRDWIEQSVAYSRNPVDLDYFEKSGFTSSFPTALAFIAAKAQSPEIEHRFFRKLLEAFQVEARPASHGTIQDAAVELGLDAGQLMQFANSTEAKAMFDSDRAAMRISGANFLSLVIEANGESVVISDSFQSADYETAIDRIAPGLHKRQPADILEYMEKMSGFHVTAKEISEVFQIPAESARAKLIRLEESGAVRKVEFAVPDLWKYGFLSADRFDEELARTSHVTPSVPFTSSGLEEVVTSAVKSLYTRVAQRPGDEFHFSPGFESATHVGYPPEVLDAIPATAVESFAGVGYPFFTEVINPGDRVLDIGSGSGTDVLISALRTGPEGEVLGLDITPAMIEKARKNARLAGALNIEIVQGQATEIPVDDEELDVVTSNGVLNLVVDKPKAYAEIFRVLRPGGWLQLADIVSDKSVAAVCGINPQLWADCVGGAATHDELKLLLESTGFMEIEFLDERDYFATSKSDTTKGLTQSFGVRSVVVRGRKP